MKTEIPNRQHRLPIHGAIPAESRQKVHSHPFDVSQFPKERLLPIIAVAWIAVITLSLAWNWHQVGKSAVSFAEAEARAAYDKDLVYRRWSALQGGVYVPITEATPPNPYLAHIPDRDIVTGDGKRLTLVNPAYMTRQVHDLGREKYGVQGHITSLKPLNPGNRADPWETEALLSFAAGGTERISLETLGGQPTLRLMRPLVTEKPCLKCHAAQGYQEGEIRGGISVTVPFAAYAAAAREQRLVLLLAHLLIGGLGLLGLWKGNTVLRSSQDALSKSEERHRSILRTAMDGFWLVDVRGRIVEVNETLCRMTGYSAEELLTMHVSDLEATKTADDFARHLEKVMTRGDNRFETKHQRKDGTVFDVEISVQYRPAAGGSDQFVAFLRDIGDQKRAEQERKTLQAQLQHAQKMEAIGTLAGGIAHDFNNILGAILGYAEMARDDCPDESLIAHDLDQVIRAGNRARDLVTQILAFSRQAEAEQVPLQPGAMVNETLKLLRSSLPTTIAIVQDIDMDAGLILADPTQIHQILMNLCTNAFHAMEETGGTLSIAVARKTLSGDDLATFPNIRPGDFVQLTIGDSGAGIPPEIRGRIFDPYFTTKETGKGTGMGLAIVHGIVESYGGFITCDSRVGGGTIFKINLPVVEQQDLPEARPHDSISLGTERILFIDDEEFLVEMNRNMLERLGYKVTVRTSSLEALNTFKNHPDDFDLVITDQTMPGMTGIDLARRMMQIRPKVPIILCTGYSSLISEEKAKALGIKGFALKPLSKSSISKIIREVLDEGKEGG
jgi:PAS domain S-box-containing protein